MKKNPCAVCRWEAECAANDWCLFDEFNKKCPNRKEGLRQKKQFMKEYLNGKYS